MDQKKLRELAEQRVLAKQGFFIHLTVYVLVNLFLLITINQPRPVIYTALFWGIGVGFHWYHAFIHSDLSKHEQRITKEMNKISEKYRE